MTVGLETEELTLMQDFGAIERERILAEDELWVVARDKYPVSPGHSLVIVKRAVARFRELTVDEKTRLLTWVDWCIAHLECTLALKPDAFNIGLNDGEAAGQTVSQLHVHVIPRYHGDVPDPRGGVRWILPDKARYWTSESTVSVHADEHSSSRRLTTITIPPDNPHE